MVGRTPGFIGLRTWLLASEVDTNPFALRTDFGIAAIDGASYILGSGAGFTLWILEGGSWI